MGKLDERVMMVLAIVFIWGGILAWPQASYAAIADSDMDSLTDESETTTYSTNPALFDTDGDGVGDGEEVVHGTSPLLPENSPLLEVSRPDVGILGNPAQWAWYMGRATGLLAFILLTLGAAYGLVMSSRAFQKVISGAVSYELHRTLSWVALAAVLLHIGSFFFDDFLHITFLEALIPGALTRSFSSALGYDMGLAVAFGIAAFYFMIILLLTSEFRAKLSQQVWRRTHYVSFLAYIAFVVHGFLAGSDSGETWVRVMYVVSLSLISVLVLLRILSRTLLPKWRARRALSQQEFSQESSLPLA
jgi:predicted ferric reductase